MKRVISVLLLVLMLTSTLCGCSSGVATIKLSETQMNMTVGDSKTLEVIAVPGDAVLKKLTWSSSDSNIVTVEQGVVKALSVGSAVIRVKTEEGLYASCDVVVADKQITDIKLNKSTTSLKVGSTIELKATVTPVDAPTGDIKWSSSDDKIAIVNSEGFVTGVKAGVAVIKCESSNSIEASCTVTVKDDSKKDSSDSAQTVVYNYYGYGHYHPDYVYSSSDFVFPDSSYRKLSHSEISTTLANMSGYSPSGKYSQDGINEIYARNGYVFKNSTIRAYYESKPWYYPDSGFTIDKLSSVEKYNVNLLTQY